ncbi:MAG: hypothetical protein MZV64_40180 [Ignavibacteriales bacterium]|nr:hypothetical protein [Ignavibacteriales bacterium]
MYTIPFNFCRYSGDEIVYNAIPLQGKRKWICATRVPYGKTVEETFKQIFSQLPNSDLLFDGCTDENKEFLKDLWLSMQSHLVKKPLLIYQKMNFKKNH